jgi:hypothetical protein
MPTLLDYQDLERQINQTVSDPDGRTLANAIAIGILAWAENSTGRIFASGAHTEYFAGDESIFSLHALPVDTNQPVTVFIFGATSKTYQPYTGDVRAFDDGTIVLDSTISSGQRMVKVNYTEGYSALPADVKQALAELLSLRFMATASNSLVEGEQTVERVTAGAGTEEYDTADAHEVIFDAVHDVREQDVLVDGPGTTELYRVLGVAHDDTPHPQHTYRCPFSRWKGNGGAGWSGSGPSWSGSGRKIRDDQTRNNPLTARVSGAVVGLVGFCGGRRDGIVGCRGWDPVRFPRCAVP